MLLAQEDKFSMTLLVYSRERRKDVEQKEKGICEIEELGLGRISAKRPDFFLPWESHRYEQELTRHCES